MVLQWLVRGRSRLYVGVVDALNDLILERDQNGNTEVRFKVLASKLIDAYLG